MGRTWKADEGVLDDFLRSTSLAVGATAAYPDEFFEGFGINRREEPRNSLLGTVLTRPAPEKFVFAVSYYDAKDGCDNEDMYTVDITTGQVRPYMGRSFEKEYPEYADHHRAKKDYFRKPPGT